MPRLNEVEAFLHSQSERDLDAVQCYKLDMTHEEKCAWIMANSDYVKRVLFKMRGFGRTCWANFLWAFNLEETLTLRRLK